MTGARLLSLVWQSINRNRRDFVFSSVGIVIGIATLIFFTALGAGIKETVLEKVFVVRQLEIEQKSYEFGGRRTSSLFGRKKLDDRVVEKLGKLDGVASVYPKMKFAFPAGFYGGKQILGQDVRGELIADGIPTELVAGDMEEGMAVAFKDYGAELACEADADCPAGHACADGVCAGAACSPRTEATDCAAPSYCLPDENVCAMPIPAIANPALLEIYNGSLHTALGGAAGVVSELPKLGQTAFIGLEAKAVLGRSFFVGAASKGKAVTRRVRLVGFSDKAINLGVTIPIGYVARFNKQFNPNLADEDDEYHSIVVETSSNDAIASVARAVTEDMGFALSDKYENAERASLLILLIQLVFNLISVIILAVAAVNIMHTFLMIILERRRELGLMRALGATRAEIRALVLTEATALGAFGGLTGVALGVLSTLTVDAIFASQVQDFPFKPDSLFVFAPWMFAVSLGAALLFCWVGALLPSIRASRIDPAAALTGR
jgi:ABC-type antimicrobial peptide transport system permease subunit